MVKAKNGRGSSGFSNRVTIEVTNTLSAPVGLSVIVNGKDIYLSWASVYGATSYEIYYSISVISQKAIRHDTFPTKNSIMLIAQNSGTYYFGVKAKNSSKTSGFSKMIEVYVY